MNNRSTPRCVIADDVRPYRELLRKWFEEWGFECVLAARADQAWEAINETDVDLVVTDIDMPEISGLQLIRAIRASDCLHQRNIPVIAISSLQDDDIDLVTKQIGAIRFIPKPLDKNDFYAMVCAVMESERIKSEEHLRQAATDSRLDSQTAAKKISPRFRRLASDIDSTPLSKKQRKD